MIVRFQVCEASIDWEFRIISASDHNPFLINASHLFALPRLAIYILFKALEVMVMVALASDLIVVQSPALIFGIMVLLIASLIYVFGFWFSSSDL